MQIEPFFPVLQMEHFLDKTQFYVYIYIYGYCSFSTSFYAHRKIKKKRGEKTHEIIYIYIRNLTFLSKFFENDQKTSFRVYIYI